MSIPDDQHTRKRVRKGTRSCWECKHRKTRCQFQSENDVACVGCLSRGTQCISQEFSDDVRRENHVGLGQRMEQIEVLLRRFMEGVDTRGRGYSTSTSPRSASGDPQINFLTPDSMNSGNVTGDESQGRISTARPYDHQRLLFNEIANSRPTSSKSELLRRLLLENLPSQGVIDAVMEASNGWWLIKRYNLPGTTLFDGHISLKSIATARLENAHPVIIARALVCIAVCMQQLPRDFNFSTLKLQGPIEETMDRLVTVVSKMVTSDEELIGSVEGIECLMLQGMFLINSGRPRRAWLNFRRAMNVAQLLGLDRRSPDISSLHVSLPPSQSSDPDLLQGQSRSLFALHPSEDEIREGIPGGLWYQIVTLDRYLALILGLPSGVSNESLDPVKFESSITVPEHIYMTRLAMTAGRVIERNQSRGRDSYGTTQIIDQELEALANSLPTSWWEVMPVGSVGTCEDMMSEHDKIMSQIWHFQIEATLHLPYMLRAATERRYEYSRFCCLRATRELLKRYMVLHSSTCKGVRCQILDFQAFTSAVTLIMGLLEMNEDGGTAEQIEQQAKDRTMIENIAQVMTELSKFPSESIAKQGAEVLKTLLDIHMKDDIKNGHLKIHIPYFGVVTLTKNTGITPAQCLVTPSDLESRINTELSTNSRGGVENTANGPLISFESSQFPGLGQESDSVLGSGALPAGDTIFFDSLINMDADGYWRF